jgi:tetratricopeptide (TPR) repeat protein
MVANKFAFRAFMLLGIASSLVVALFLAYVGMLGTTAQAFLREAWAPVEKFYRLNQQASDVALTALGVIVYAASAAFAMVKTWHYAELQLPSRVEEFIHDQIERFRQHRPALVGVLRAGAEPQAFLEPTFRTQRFNSVLQALGLADQKVAAQQLATSAHLLGQNLAIVEARRAQLLAEKATVHLLRGLHWANVAFDMETGSPQQRETNEKALVEFNEALELQPDDIEALEAVASQCLVLGRDQDALALLGKLREAAEKLGVVCAQARALRLEASVRFKQDSSQEWIRARILAEIVIGLLRTDLGDGQHFNARIELAEAHLLHGEVQMKREKFSAARTSLLAASGEAHRVPEHYKSGLQSRIANALADYEIKSKDPES